MAENDLDQLYQVQSRISNVLNWFLAILCIVMTALSLLRRESNIFSAILFLLGGILIFPPFSKFLSSKLPFLSSKFKKSLLLLILVIGGVFLNPILKFYSNSSSMESTGKTTLDLNLFTDVDFELTAYDLYKAYDTNEIKASELYQGKTVKISGNFLSIQKQSGGYIKIEIDSGFLSGISCILDDDTNVEILDQIAKNQQIIIVGEVSDFIVKVLILDNCKLLL